LYAVDNGITVEGGYLLDNGIPVKVKILLYNEFNGVKNYVALDFTAYVKFDLTVTWDDYWVYPHFGSCLVIDPKVLFDGVVLDEAVEFD